MQAVASDEGLCVFDFEYRKMMDKIIERVEKTMNEKIVETAHPYFNLLEEQIIQYFDGSRKIFDLPLHLIGSDFQKRVWQGLMEIPYGEIRTYKTQAMLLGDIKAIRAMASANGQNGLSIIIPCHRVIGTNGSLVGYGGGLQRKKWLLEHERKQTGLMQQAQLF